MFDLESTAHRLADLLLKDVPFDNGQKSRVEYGLSLLLGVTTELSMTMAVSALFDTALYTLIIMLSALSLRIFTGGVHCSSFRRCLVFTIIYFIGLSMPVKAAATSMEYKALMWVSLFIVLAALLFLFIWKPKRLTLMIWIICAGLPILGLVCGSAEAWRILTLPVAVGIAFQVFIVSPLGEKVVLHSDKIMRRLGI